MLRRVRRDAIRAFGLDPAAIAEARVTGPTLGYLEFHIEQGPVLESLNLPLGVVTAIAGQSRLRSEVRRQRQPRGHDADASCGGTRWRERRNGSAPWSAKPLRSRSLVATVGKIEARAGSGQRDRGLRRA